MNKKLLVCGFIIICAISMLLGFGAGDGELFGASRFSPGGGSPLSQGFWKLVGTVLTPVNSSWTIAGSTASGSSTRVAFYDANDTLGAGTSTFTFTSSTGVLTAPLLSITSSTNGVLAGSGTASNPTYSFTSDPDTGMWNAAANTISFSVGGAKVLEYSAANGFAANGSTSIPTARIQNVLVGGNATVITGSTGAFGATSTSSLAIGRNAANDSMFYGREFAFSSSTNPSSMSATDLTMYESAVSTVTLTNGTLTGYGNMNLGRSSSTSVYIAAGGVTSTSAVADFPGLGAPGVTADLVCWTAVTGRLTHQATTCTVSSERFKKNIQSLNSEELMERVRRLRAVEYDYKESGKHDEGFIAEEVALIDPYLVVFEETKDVEAIKWVKDHYPTTMFEKDGKVFIPKSVDYARISVLTVGAIQAQQDAIDKLQQQMSSLGGIFSQCREK